jgi:WD40 repeat protein
MLPDVTESDQLPVPRPRHHRRGLGLGLVALAVALCLGSMAAIWGVTGFWTQTVAKRHGSAADGGSGDQGAAPGDAHVAVEFVGTFDPGNGALAGAFSPDGRLLATADDINKTARLWDVAGRKLIATMDGGGGIGGPGDVVGVGFSPDGKTLAVDCYGGTISFWDVATHRRIAKIDDAHPSDTTMTISPDWRYFVTYKNAISERFVPNSDGGMEYYPGQPAVQRLWGMGSSEKPISIDPADQVLFPPGAPPLEMAEDGHHTIRLYEPAKHRLVDTFEGHTEKVTAHAFSPSGTVLVTGSEDGTVRLWDIVAHQATKTLTGPTDAVTGVAFSADSRLLVSTSRDQVARLWNASTYQAAGTIPNADQATLGPDGHLLLTTTQDGLTGLWRVGDNAPELLYPELPKAVFSPDGGWLAGFSDQIGLWRLTTG